MSKKNAKLGRPEGAVPWIICCGTHGRCVVFGWLDEEPQVGVPVKMWDARMVLEWPADCAGLFGLAAAGPKPGVRLTRAVACTFNTPKQGIRVLDNVAAALQNWD